MLPRPAPTGWTPDTATALPPTAPQPTQPPPRLTQDLAPSVLGRVLGLHPMTATQWRSRAATDFTQWRGRAATDWTAYLSARIDGHRRVPPDQAAQGRFSGAHTVAIK
ncbi:hypothetical protein [Streptomyces sp. NBC_01334]|uniref:hypothetical protein n=1 Tax=Streptomyces sp. NBC_01334 TaxID=2903827 RepID=UPI002E15B7BD|nr:hypothetical protein OG736_05835 [Streptomyces sp. NBC_01334]